MPVTPPDPTPADPPAGGDDGDGEVRITVYEAVGGQAFFDRLVDAFYAGVEADELLRPMYPDDLTDAKAHLAGFLAQYWGGPPDYSRERGHPRLRMRHAPFVIGPAEAAAWYRHMETAVTASGVHPEIARLLLSYFEQAAGHLVNQA